MKRFILFSLLFAGCVPLHTAHLDKEASLVLSPSFLSRETLALVPPHSLASIATLDIIPNVFEGGAYKPISALTGLALSSESPEMLKLSQASPSIDPNRPFVIRKLKPGKQYRVTARAWNMQNQPISNEASSSLEVLVGSDDAPTLATLPIYLNAVPFAASTQVQINLDRPGKYDYLRATLFQGSTQIGVIQTTRKNPNVVFGNLEGNTSYRLVAEAFQGSEVLVASASMTLAIAEDNAPAPKTLSMTLPLAWNVSAFASPPGPHGLAIDPSGNVFVADYGGHYIHKINPQGVATVIAGNGTPSSVDGNGTNATVNAPHGIVIDKNGMLYFTEYGGNRVRKLDPQGNVTTIAGNGDLSSVDGQGTQATFNHPHGIAIDGSGNLYVVNLGNAIRKITPTGTVTTLFNVAAGLVDGPLASARFNGPMDLVMADNGDMFVADGGNQAIRKISADGFVSTVAGGAGAGAQDGTGSGARFNGPRAIAIGNNGNLYVCDAGNLLIRQVTQDGRVTTIAGSGGTSNTYGPALSAGFGLPVYLRMDSLGNLYMTDWIYKVVKKLQ